MTAGFAAYRIMSLAAHSCLEIGFVLNPRNKMDGATPLSCEEMRPALREVRDSASELCVAASRSPASAAHGDGTSPSAMAANKSLLHTLDVRKPTIMYQNYPEASDDADQGVL